MTVGELIDFLNNIDDKNEKVYVMDQGNSNSWDIDYALEIKSCSSKNICAYPVGVNLLCYM